MLAITETPINVSALLSIHGSSEDGALASFFGIVRRDSDRAEVKALVYEAYIPMALKVFKNIERTAISRWGITSLSIVHRIGTVPVGGIAVAITVCSKHRKEAMDACSFAIESVKKSAPIWKKEIFPARSGKGEKIVQPH